MTAAASLSPESAEALALRGEAVLLDVRPPAAFAGGHPIGALSVPFSPRGLAERVRVAVPGDRSVVLVAPDEATGAAAATQLETAGIALRGVVDLVAWRAAGLPTSAVEEVPAASLPSMAGKATVIDVREPVEWSTGHVPGALLIPLGQLRDALPSLPRDAPVVTICEAGVRSCVAASILQAAGFTKVSHVPEGTSGYRRSGSPLEFPPDGDPR